MAKKRKEPAATAPTIRDRIKELRRVKASELQASPHNWRTHPQSQQDALKGVLAEIGYADALIARELPSGSLELIDGHLRRDTTPDQMVPVLVLDVDEGEARKLLATLDPLAAMATADSEQLAALLASVNVGDAALSAMLEGLAKEHGVTTLPTPGDGGDEFDATPEEGPTRTNVGEVWVIGGVHRLLVGDCTDKDSLNRLLEGNRAKLIVTSPPYNQDIGNFSKSGMHKETRWIDNTVGTAYRDDLPEEEYQKQQANAMMVWRDYLEDDASIFYNHKNRYREKQVVSPWTWLAQTGAKVRQEIIWYREGSVTMNARMFNPSDERIFWLYFGKEFYFSDVPEHRVWSSVWKIASHKDTDGATHPCAFPLELASRPIAACSRSGGVVLEPYCGSGTTLIAAHRLNRRCFGCEIEPRYADVVLRRAEAEGLTVEREVL